MVERARRTRSCFHWALPSPLDRGASDSPPTRRLPSCKDVRMSMPTPEDCAASADELRAVVEELNAVIQRLDAFDMEDAEVMSLRLQMAMDRLSKSRSTLSNILK
jgi:hypothetical protein